MIAFRLVGMGGCVSLPARNLCHTVTSRHLRNIDPNGSRMLLELYRHVFGHGLSRHDWMIFWGFGVFGVGV